MRLTSILTRCLQTGADREATVYGHRRTTWAETADRVARGGALLAAAGVKPGDRVAVLALNSDTFFQLLFAVPWVGGIIVPLNTRWSVAELERALHDCGAKVLIADAAFADAATRLVELIPDLHPFFIGEGETPDGFANYEVSVKDQMPVPEYMGSPDELWGILYTGGTTGHPKGVMLSHTNLFVTGLFWLGTCHFHQDSRYLHIAGFFHIVSTVPAMAVSMAGGTHVIEGKFDPVPTMKCIQENRVNASTFVPTMLNMMLHDPHFEEYDLTSMGQCIYGGSPIPDALIDLMIRKLPTWEFIQGYGQTESTGILSQLPWKAHFGEGRANKRKATGIPVYGACLKIVDPDGRELGPNQQGEIVVQGLNVMQGYWNNEKATRTTIRDGWLHTGDAAWMDEDGFLTVVDRLKDMIVTGGENVFSIEVENAISSHPAVQQCAVVSIPDPKWGEAVHAVVTFKVNHTATAEEIIAHCKTLIANYKCPRSVEFIAVMPISAAGKIMKGELRKKYWENREKQVG